ncbi:MAG: hypothetical protein ACRDNF_25820, partial [Streptosporangiaceae bacterium]
MAGSRAWRLVRGGAGSGWGLKGWHGWLRRGVLAGVLAAAAFAPYQSAGSASPSCRSSSCRAGTVLWTHQLPGSWTASNNLLGTVPDQPSGGTAYA